MRHRKGGRKFGRNTKQRNALLRSLATSFLESERLETTVAKAKALRPVAEKLITLGKRGDLAARRLAARYVLTPKAVKRLFDDLGPRVKTRPGGYTRILRTGTRYGDAAPMAVIEMVDKPEAKAEGESAGKSEKPRGKKTTPGQAAKTPRKKKKEEPAA
ncbi:MAG: 50S ribosomal protein L17 [Nitrospirae bacterium]|nr:50S ribosomal protein L17 [Nitrospirota bacterium]MBI3393405.1 50S ribosomal protein L17 [Nitrospirota bacterium]